VAGSLVYTVHSAIPVRTKTAQATRTLRLCTVPLSRPPSPPPLPSLRTSFSLSHPEGWASRPRLRHRLWL
jgi:hypothetical protein